MSTFLLDLLILFSMVKKTNFTNLFSPKNFQDNYNVILKYFLNWNIDIKMVEPSDHGKIIQVSPITQCQAICWNLHKRNNE